MIDRLTTALSDRYRIEVELGQGGMATVYRAHDVRHDRKVAVKILHPELAAVLGAERFLTEMRVTANLQHPHILPLFDSGTADGQLYYVMPLVEGESLRDRLTRERQLPIEDAVRLSIEVAGALDYAHRHNVVHRDIKPENILLHDGSALVADFGIALAVSSAGGKRLTQTGLSLGTPHYMSPEQATGDKVVDGRADIYSLGCVLFEMLTGEPPFNGPSTQAIVAKVLTEATPSVRARRATVPPALEGVILKALQKLPADRFATPQAFAQALRAPEQAAAIAAPGSRARSTRRWLSIATPVIGAGALYGAYMLGGRSGFSAGGGDWIIEQLGGPQIAMQPRVSPDGKTIAFAAMVGNQTQLAVLSPESGDWRVLTSDTTRGFVSTPAWSHDGTRIYYSRFNESPNGIYSITPLGTDDRLVLEQADMPLPLEDGSLLVSRLNGERRLQLYRYWPESAKLDTLPASTGAEWGKAFARVFPDGKEAAFVGAPGPRADGPEALFAIHLESGTSRRLWDGPIAMAAGNSFGVTADNRSVLVPITVGAGYGVAVVSRDGSGRSHTAISTTAAIAGVDGGPDGTTYIDQIDRACVWFRYDPVTRVLEHLDILKRCQSQFITLPDGRLLETEVGAPNRVVALRPGSPATRFLQLAQQHHRPAPLGRDRILVQLGSGDTLLIASVATGQVISRIPWMPDAFPFAGSPDGATIFYARAGSIWSVSTTGSEPRRIRDGDQFAVDPAGRYLIVEVQGADGVRLFHTPLDGTEEHEIPVRSGSVRLAPNAINLNSIAPDGRILVTVVSASLWHWPAGILDPRTGALTLLPVSTEYDLEAAWGFDGRIWIGGSDLEASMWRYRPANPR